MTSKTQYKDQTVKDLSIASEIPLLTNEDSFDFFNRKS